MSRFALNIISAKPQLASPSTNTNRDMADIRWWTYTGHNQFSSVASNSFYLSQVTGNVFADAA
jgi:hypothetical protein